MENKHNPSNTENYNTKSIGPSTDELRDKFKEGSIPLEEDFYDLIDIADIGRKATGQEPGQNDNSDSALELDQSGLLMVKINPRGGLKKDKDGLAVQASNGINVDINGVSVKPKPNGSISVDPDGVSVNIQEIASVLAGLIIPIGTIVPFYSNNNYNNPNPPLGWAWCDGNNGTPNLNNNPPIAPDKNSICLILGSTHAYPQTYKSKFNSTAKGGDTTVYCNFMRYIIKIKTS
ncbi:hypothetical protein ABLB90_14550 [Photorhabdus bodei]|uniref:hypothetical protein n=1 Tax=Photorhabdus bodei TaxID=2029681 RepID=UPI0032B7007E